MRREIVLWCAMSCLVFTVACGKSEEEKKVEDVQKAAEQVQDSASEMAKGLQEMAKGFQGLAGGDPDQKPVDPVGFRELQAAFGDLSGWEKGKPTGERMTSPVNYSVAKVTYTKGDETIDAEISDSAFNQMMLIPFATFLTAGYEKETEHGYEKSVKIGEFPGWEKWDSEDKSGEISALVNKRFVVELSGHNLSDVKELQRAMQAMDMQKLARLQ